MTRDDAPALAAGTGVGGDLLFYDAQLAANSSLAVAPSDIDADWFLPLWASATIKPWCDVGVQAYASYDVHPTAIAESAPTFAVSLMWQPNKACSEPSGLTTHTL